MEPSVPPVELRQLRAFLVVAEEAHVGRAAARLGIAQPPLSQQIQRLEARIGVALFERHPRGVRLTDAGRELVPAARAALAGVAQGVQDARRVAQGLTGQLKVGIAASLSLRVLPQLLADYRREHPAVSLQLREMTTDPQLDALHAGTIDVGIGREVRPRTGIDAVACWEEEIVVALPSAHPLTRRRHVTVAALAAETFVLFPADAGAEFHAHLLSICAGAGFAPRIAHEAVEWATVIAYVAAGLGVTLAPASIRALRPGGVAYRAIGRPAPRTTISLCWRSQDRRPVVRGFLKTAGGRR